MNGPDKRDNQMEISEEASRLGTSCLGQGEISGKDDLIIQGRWKGQVNLTENNILVEESGTIEAEVQAKNVIIQGEVLGNVSASGKVFIAKTGRMKGDLSASSVSIAEGAQFKGSIRILGPREIK